MKALVYQTLDFFSWSEVNYGAQLRNGYIGTQGMLQDLYYVCLLRLLSQILFLFLLNITVLSIYSYTSWRSLLVGVYVLISEAFWDKRRSRIYKVTDFSHGIINVLFLFIAEYRAQRLKPTYYLLLFFIYWVMFFKLDLNTQIWEI